MRPMVWLAVVLLGLLVVSGLVGCGGSDEVLGSGVDTAGKPPPADTSSYYVTPLPPPAGAVKVVATAVSEVGTDSVLWVGGNDQGAPIRAVVWKVVLPATPSGTPVVTSSYFGSGASEVCDINQYGRAVSYESQTGCALYYAGRDTTPYFFKDGISTTYARGIGTDDATVRIAGYGASGALLWEFSAGSDPQTASPTVLPDFEGQPSGQPYTSAEDLCDTDGIVRIAGRMEDPDNPGKSASVLWTRTSSGAFTVEKLAAYPAYGQEVNASGQVVGLWANNYKDAWSWQSDVLAILPWIGGKWTFNNARGVNDGGVVVGNVEFQQNLVVKALKAVLWRNGQAIDLNSLVKVTGGLTEARDINNQGMIVAVGPGAEGNLSAYLLRPK